MHYTVLTEMHYNLFVLCKTIQSNKESLVAESSYYGLHKSLVGPCVAQHVFGTPPLRDLLQLHAGIVLDAFKVMNIHSTKIMIKILQAFKSEAKNIRQTTGRC